MILDVCCGAEKMYQGYGKDQRITMDIRFGDFTYSNDADVSKRSVIVSPDIIANMRAMPMRDGVFDMVVCDPPHMKCGLTGFMCKQYGSWNQSDTIETMAFANNEFARVLRDGGVLVLKVLREQMDRYEKMLTNFAFILPIRTIRASGCIETKAAKAGAMWMIAIKR